MSIGQGRRIWLEHALAVENVDARLSCMQSQFWEVKLICWTHNHEMAKSFVGHPYAGRLSKDEKILVADMTKFMVKPRNILLELKERNANSYTTIKQIYNAKNAYCSSIRKSNTKMQQLTMLLDRDQYIHWHMMKDENVVCDLCECMYT